MTQKFLKLISATFLFFMMLFFAELKAQDVGTSAVDGVGSTVANSTGQVQNIWSKLLPSAEQVKKCKDKFCDCCVGKLLSNMLLPLSLMTGGCIKPCCPPIPAKDAKRSSATAQGACAKIAADNQEAFARRDAVRCLARTDCNWWPEIELALINALRADKSECVRFEAALVIGNGCCCTKKMIEALTICINASSKDGNPPENSQRVRMQALNSLQHCLSCYKEKADPVRPEFPGNALPKPADMGAAKAIPEDFQLVSYYINLDKTPSTLILSRAGQTLEMNKAMLAAKSLPGRKGLLDIISAAKNPAENQNPGWNDRLEPRNSNINLSGSPATLPPAFLKN
ncbi:MAG: hypothetical protein ACK5E4_13445 [Planctomycetia bacterium]